MTLHRTSSLRLARFLESAERSRVTSNQLPNGGRVVDCGVSARGGIEAGIALAELCLGGLGEVRLEAGRAAVPVPLVTVQTDQPLTACLASQYAGWRVSEGDFFGMLSGPIRAAGSREALLDELGLRVPAVAADEVVGVLEAGSLPAESIVAQLAEACGLAPERVTLLVAPTASLAGTLQVVARSVETALHKLHELKFDMRQVVSGFGEAPLPPVAADDLQGIGWTNDAILFGARVNLWVDSDPEVIERVGPQVPSSASRDYGRPFKELFAAYDHEFYKIDPLLFSPAEVTFHNLRSGRTRTFGAVNRELLRDSWGLAGPDQR